MSSLEGCGIWKSARIGCRFAEYRYRKKWDHIFVPVGEINLFFSLPRNDFMVH